MKIELGITGGIGSGKSVVSRLLRVMGVPVYDCDSNAKQLMQQSPALRSRLSDLLGSDIYSPDGTLDRRLMARRLFGDPALLQQVNKAVHPAVLQHFKEWSATQAAPIVGIESAILFEAHYPQHLTTVVNVTAPIELRIRRTAQRDGATPAEVERRIASQLPEEERTARSPHLISNDDRHSLIEQTEALLNLLKEMAAKNEAVLKE